MIQIKTFVFSDFQENTFLLYDETGEALLVDPGCYREQEKKELSGFISANNLSLVKVIYTHCHLDHIFGAHYIGQTYPGVGFEAHRAENDFIERYDQVAGMFGVTMEKPPALTGFIEEGMCIKWGDSSLDTFHIPGHSQGSLCFYNREQNFVIVGDVLFAGSIGRTDLPGGDMSTLLSGIRKKLFSLPEDCAVFSGHGPSTEIGREKRENPFFQMYGT